MTSNDDDLVSLHEAAHAVVGQAAGMDVKELTLHRGSRLGERGSCSLWNYGAERDRDPVRFLVFLLAGASAEQKACGHYTPRDAGDREQAINFAAAVLEEEPSSPRVRAMVERAQRIADTRLENDVIWEWVQRVAQRLVKRRRLSGRDIFELGPHGPHGGRQ
jgi:hypothetical protein